MNLINYAHRLYKQGHVPEDFRGGGAMKRGLVVLSPVRPPNITEAGIIRPDASAQVPGQYALSHRVEAVGEQTPDAVRVNVGDIVKCREGHLDILDPFGNLLAIRDEHILKVVIPVEGVPAEAPAVPS
jgi:hypothetical protein